MRNDGLVGVSPLCLLMRGRNDGLVVGYLLSNIP